MSTGMFFLEGSTLLGFFLLLVLADLREKGEDLKEDSGLEEGLAMVGLPILKMLFCEVGIEWLVGWW